MNSTSEDINLFQLISKSIIFIKMLLKKYFIVLFIVSLMGAIIGFYIAKLKKPNYEAILTFIVEEGRTSSGLAAIAGQFGFDLNGGNNATLFSGDNILMFLTSKSLTKETLLTSYSFNQSSSYTLADKYAEASELKNKWVSKKIVPENFYFDTTKKTRLQDSLLQLITDNILLNELKVERPEKKATFIKVQCNLKDELLTKLFCERLVKIATEKYIQSKTTRQKKNVDRLEKRADSLNNVLNGKTYTSASSMQELIDINPANKVITVNAELNNRDKLMLSQLYAEVIKNLELSKIQLNQETPTIQIIDSPDLPLKKSKSSKLVFAIIGFLFTSFFCLAILAFIQYNLTKKASVGNQ